jgi:hypothetical protein
VHDYNDKEWRVRSPVVDYLPFLKYKGVVNIIKTDVEIELDKNMDIFLIVGINTQRFICFKC